MQNVFLLDRKVFLMSELTMMNKELKSIWRIESEGTFRGFGVNGYTILVNKTFITVLNSRRNVIEEVKSKDLQVNVPHRVLDGTAEVCRITLLKKEAAGQ
jgi:hypothetical protein